MELVLDIEADGLKPTEVFCIVCIDRNTGKLYVWRTPAQFQDFVTFANKEKPTFIGHNILSYDIPVLKRLLGLECTTKQIIDTLIMSRLFNYTRQGGHSLDSWGERLSFPKTEFNDFTKYSDEMLKYCINDVRLNNKVYTYLLNEGKDFSDYSIRLEHNVQRLLDISSDKGFPIDHHRALDLYSTCKFRAMEIEESVKKVFPPKPKSKRLIEVKVTKSGELSKSNLRVFKDCYDVVGGNHNLIEWSEFNLSSPKQIVERMEEYGWKPTVFNKPTPLMKSKGIKQGSPVVCEENLNTLPEDAPEEAKLIVEYLICTHRYKMVQGWFDNLKNHSPSHNVKCLRVHGRTLGIGANTHRMAHSNPNLANIPSVSKDKDGKVLEGLEGSYGFESRSCFRPPRNFKMVGCDASGIQLRILAHLMNDKEYTGQIVSGDIHSYNQELAGLESRDQAKTFIYAWLLGAGYAKLGSIVGGTYNDGKELNDRFLDRLPTLARVKEDCKKWARQGYWECFDGRRIQVSSAHFALAVALQGGEQAVMKRALVQQHHKLRRFFNRRDYWVAAVVHDEFQSICKSEVAITVGEAQSQAIEESGEYFKLNCPLKAEYRIGESWAQTH